MRLQLESATDVINLDDVLMRGEGFQAMPGLTGLGLPDISTQWLAGAGDGALFRGQRVLPRDIDLPLYFSAPDRAGLQRLVSRLALMMAGPCTLRLVEDGGSSWYTEVRRVGGGDYVYGVDTIGNQDLRLVLTLRAGQPYWTSSVETRKVIEHGSGGRGLLLSGLARLQVAASQAIGSMTLENTGDAPAYPVWEVNGPGSAFHARSVEGHEFMWVGTLLPDEKLIVDTGSGAVTDGTGVNRYAELAPAPKLWSIPPGTTTAHVSLEDTSAGTLAPRGAPIWTNYVTNPRGENATGETVVRRNYFRNPSQEPGGDRDIGGGWIWASEFGFDATAAYSGTRSSWMTTSNADGTRAAGFYIYDLMAGQVAEGDPLTCSVYMRSDEPCEMQASMVAYSADFDELARIEGPVADLPANTWTRVHVTSQSMPAEVDKVYIEVVTTDINVPHPPDGTALWWDAVLYEKTTVLDSYFDGSTDPTDGVTYRWVDMAHGSVSEAVAPQSVGQAVSVSGDSAWFPYWAAGTAGTRHQRWRAVAGSPTTSNRVARSTAVSHTDITAGQQYTLLVRMRMAGWPSDEVSLRIANEAGSAEVMPSTHVFGVGAGWMDARIHFTALADAGTDADIGLHISLPDTLSPTTHGQFDLAHWALISGSYTGSYFDGDSLDSLTTGVHQWTGVNHASASTRSLPQVVGRSSISCTWRPRRWMVI
ncbi:hypothetical protein [Salinispora pacifica]|uniref:hypothetical protein n=1 Tax=Salinispora pacifica TaxID=351187 RepID=UPI0004AE1DEB|nr:hypothetical protein [Salinispora pacifica]